ncbi:hypothetical protein Tco_1114449 [Tanacetum coccineum]|uniref:Uncharacterized protein n=1 Tax=Tanacetum coccineum TaxID=301880 RepID=A0ABQ5IVJ7_9ASTR
MLLNMDQLEKQLNNEEFQKIGSMAPFKVLETKFQMFIKSRIYLDDEYVMMTHNYFLQYTQLKIPKFHDTLIQHMESVKKSIDERALHKREYDTRVNERQMQTTKGKVDTCKALDASLVNTVSSGTELVEQDTISRSGNDAHAHDADIRLIYDEEPMAKVQLIANHNVFATRQPHTKQPEFNNDEEVDQNAKQCHDKLDVNNDLSKPLTTYYLPKGKESACAKPHHMIAPGSSRWVPTGKIFTSSTTKVDSEPTNGSNDDITNQYECKQTLDVSVGSKTLSWKPCQGVSSKLNLPDHRYKQRYCSLIPAESDSLPHAHAHAQTTKSDSKHQDSRIKKAQELKIKTFANSDIKDNSSKTKLQERLLESFQEDVKYKHVGQDTRSQDGKDDQD